MKEQDQVIQRDMSMKTKMLLWIGLIITVPLVVLSFVVIPKVTEQQETLAYQEVREMTLRCASDMNTPLAEFRKLSHTLTYVMQGYDYDEPNRDEINQSSVCMSALNPMPLTGGTKILKIRGEAAMRDVSSPSGTGFRVPLPWSPWRGWIRTTGTRFRIPRVSLPCSSPFSTTVF